MPEGEAREKQTFVSVHTNEQIDTFPSKEKNKHDKIATNYDYDDLWRVKCMK